MVGLFGWIALGLVLVALVVINVYLIGKWHGQIQTQLATQAQLLEEGGLSEEVWQGITATLDQHLQTATTIFHARRDDALGNDVWEFDHAACLEWSERAGWLGSNLAFPLIPSPMGFSLLAVPSE